MPLPSSRMSKQPARPVRYFPGKALVEDPVSDEEDSEEEEQVAPRAPAPQATSFPKKSFAVDIGKPSTIQPAPAPRPENDLDGFVTASESEDEEGGEASSDEAEDSSGDEDSSSDDEPKKPMLAPKFVSKAKRAQQAASTPTLAAEQQAAEEERKRQEKADEMLQAQIERDQAARKAGRRYWDDDDVPADEVDEVDDTDDLDPEAEKAAWKLRELKRVQRDRQALVAKEQEREEVERRRNMTAEEREAADREYIAQQTEEREGKGKMAYMQKYFHKGAFFNAEEEQDEEVKNALNRDIAGRKFVDDAGDKAVLPEYMRIRDMTKLGKSGRTKYKDLKSEDTGQWGRFEGKKRDFDGLDERFRPDERGASGAERTGANSAPVGERRRRDDDGGREEKRTRYD